MSAWRKYELSKKAPHYILYGISYIFHTVHWCIHSWRIYLLLAPYQIQSNINTVITLTSQGEKHPWKVWKCGLGVLSHTAYASEKTWKVVVTQRCPTLANPCDPIALQAPLSTGFPRQEYWRGLPFPPPGDLLHPEIKSESLAQADRFFTTEPPGNAVSRQGQS